MKVEDYNNYKVGALKRKFKTGRADVEVGTFINLANAQKVAKNKDKIDIPTEVAIMGMV